MAGHSNTIRGIGKTLADAESNAIADFLHEEGHRHSVRGTEQHKMIRKVPPQKRVEERRGGTTYIKFVDDPDAPAEQWLEEWEFVLNTHT